MQWRARVTFEWLRRKCQAIEGFLILPKRDLVSRTAANVAEDDAGQYATNQRSCCLSAPGSLTRLPWRHGP